MKNYLKLFIFTPLFFGCAHEGKRYEFKDWVNRPTEELAEHSMFSLLPQNKRKRDNGIEIITYNFRPRFAVVASGTCTYIFYTKNNIITKADYSGECPNRNYAIPEKNRK